MDLALYRSTIFGGVSGTSTKVDVNRNSVFNDPLEEKGPWNEVEKKATEPRITSTSTRGSSGKLFIPHN